MSMRILNETLLTDGDVSGDLSSAPLLLAYAFGYAIQAVFTGSPSGTLKLQGSNDSVPNAQFVETPPSNWTDIDGSSTSISASGTVLLNAQGVYFTWVRAVFTPSMSPGTGTMSVTGNTKGF